MATATEIKFETRTTKINEVLSELIPPRETWTPVDEALYTPIDPLRVPKDEAEAMRLKAIKHAFARQYALNKFYHRYCDKQRVTPDDIKTNDDLEKIPLVPDQTFKQHPSGEDFGVLDRKYLYRGPAPRGDRPLEHDVRRHHQRL